MRHLEEVDILRHLASSPHRNVITFVDAWEQASNFQSVLVAGADSRHVLQNRQLFIQTDLYLGTLAYFLEEYGRMVERLEEARAWKICRELADVSGHPSRSKYIRLRSS